MKKTTLTILISILLIGGAIASIVLSNIKPEISPKDVQDLKDCIGTATYKILNESCIDGNCDVWVEFNTDYKTNIPVRDDESFEDNLKSELEYMILGIINNCTNSTTEQNKHQIPDDWIDLEK